MSWRFVVRIVAGILAGNRIISPCASSTQRAIASSALSTSPAIVSTSPILLQPATAPIATTTKKSAPSKATSKSFSETSGSTPSSRTKTVCRAHVIHFGSMEGTPLARRPRNGKHVQNVPLLPSGRLVQNGHRAQEDDKPIYVQMCRKHREVCQSRRMGNKCQQPDCYHQGILVERRGVKIIECPVRHRKRLDNHDLPAKGMMESRMSKVSPNRESSADTTKSPHSGHPHHAQESVVPKKETARERA